MKVLLTMYITAWLLLFSDQLKAQDSAANVLIGISQNVVYAEVIEIGRKHGGEDGIIQYSILCHIEKSYKGALIAGQYVAIQIVEPKTPQPGDTVAGSQRLIAIGTKLLFFISSHQVAETQFSTIQPISRVYALADDWLGIQIPTPSLLYKLNNGEPK